VPKVRLAAPHERLSAVPPSRDLRSQVRGECAKRREGVRGCGFARVFFAAENLKWWTLGAVSFGLFMIMLDNTVVNVALPSIRSDLGISISELEWVANPYALTFVVLLLGGGKSADLLGQPRETNSSVALPKR
jgi:hypothetical protein